MHLRSGLPEESESSAPTTPDLLHHRLDQDHLQVDSGLILKTREEV